MAKMEELEFLIKEIKKLGAEERRTVNEREKSLILKQQQKLLLETNEKMKKLINTENFGEV